MGFWASGRLTPAEKSLYRPINFDDDIFHAFYEAYLLRKNCTEIDFSKLLCEEALEFYFKSVYIQVCFLALFFSLLLLIFTMPEKTERPSKFILFLFILDFINPFIQKKNRRRNLRQELRVHIYQKIFYCIHCFLKKSNIQKYYYSIVKGIAPTTLSSQNQSR